MAMSRFLLRKAGAALIVVFLASVLVFVGVRAIPGDPATALAGEEGDPAAIEAIRHQYLLDRPLPVQYVALDLARRAGRPRRRPEPDPDRAHDRAPAAAHARARDAEPAARDPDRRPGGGDRGGPARGSDRPRCAVRGADRAVGAALLARAAADHLVRGRPRLAAGDRLRLDAPSDRRTSSTC